MASLTRPRGYSALQITLHWVIAALVVFQLLFGEDIVPAYSAFRRGTAPEAADLFNANIHVVVGFAILLLALVRLVLRLRLGAPAAPAGESAFQRAIAAAAHFVLYAAILVMPVTGALAWFGGVHAAGEVHEIGKPVIIVVVLLHAAGALWHHFVVRNDTLVRMLRPQR